MDPRATLLKTVVLISSSVISSSLCTGEIKKIDFPHSLLLHKSYLAHFISAAQLFIKTFYSIAILIFKLSSYSKSRTDISVLQPVCKGSCDRGCNTHTHSNGRENKVFKSATTSVKSLLHIRAET